MYEYSARLVRVIDGDTVEMDIDLGCYVSIREKVRLAGIDAPELRGKEKEAGYQAKAFLIDLLSRLDQLVIKTHKDKRGKYGRFIVDISGISGKEATRTDVNASMVVNGHAVWSDY